MSSEVAHQHAGVDWGTATDCPICELNDVAAERDRLRARVAEAIALLNDAWYPVAMEYDTQGVNQAHRVLCGGPAPRATRQHDVDEDAP